MTDKEMILNRMREILATATCQEYKLGMSNYKWEIGIDIFNKLISEVNVMYNVDDSIVHTLLGKPFDVNGKDKDVIKLWRQVI